MPTFTWQPSANQAMLVARANLYHQLRTFFAERGVLEVDTPLLSQAAVPEPNIEPLATQLGSQTYYLQTSPELPMKRLLAAGSGAIYQICKVCRADESGRLHNPEFTMLEWYRPDFDHHALIAEVDALLQYVLNTQPACQISYQHAFKQYLDIEPLVVPLQYLHTLIAQHGIDTPENYDRDTCLQLLLSLYIEPQFDPSCPTILMSFPASQAALARRLDTTPEWAARFEVYLGGMELANGFYELADVAEQRARFTADLAKRCTQNQKVLPLDERFLAALEAGLPDCAGVALGVDRLLMLQTGAQHINEVLAFPSVRA